MIELGLARIGRLLNGAPQPWKAVHVAGTNGKGSICAYITSILSAAGYRCGRFTSPHTIDYWDGIQIPRKGGDKTVPKLFFKYIETQVRKRNRKQSIGATEFEIHTATAFILFSRYAVDIAVIEVGLGGELDATNILAHKSVTVISKIGLDHQKFLGNTIEEITKHKAGIMRSNVPCVLDDSNLPQVKKVIEDHAKKTNAKVIPSSRGAILRKPFPPSDKIGPLRAPHEWQNFTCAYTASKIIHPNLALPNRFFHLIGPRQLPGRLARTRLRAPFGPERWEKLVLLDGAHNEQSAQALGSFVEHIYRWPKSLESRSQKQKVTWLIALSTGRHPRGMLEPLIKEGDTVVAVEFGPVHTMPWIKATASRVILDTIGKLEYSRVRLYDCGTNMAVALQTAIMLAGEEPLVIAGSLYLVSDILRNERQERESPTSLSRGQIYRKRMLVHIRQELIKKQHYHGIKDIRLPLIISKSHPPYFRLPRPLSTDT